MEGWHRHIDLHPFRHGHSVCVGIVSDDERAILSIRISNSNIQGLAIQHLMPWGLLHAYMCTHHMRARQLEQERI